MHEKTIPRPNLPKDGERSASIGQGECPFSLPFLFRREER